MYDIDKMRGIPTFFSGDTGSVFTIPDFSGLPWTGAPDAFFITSFVTILVVSLFGGIHLFAWNYIFPNNAEGTFWRIAAAIVTGAPGVVFVVWILCIIPLAFDNTPAAETMMAAASIFSTAVYVVARLTLLVISFTSLRQLSPDVYKTSSWLTIPFL